MTETSRGRKGSPARAGGSDEAQRLAVQVLDGVDQFLLGDRLLVAPVVEKDARNRTVNLPPGKWHGFDGKRYAGPAKLTLPVGLDELCYFEKVGQPPASASSHPSGPIAPSVAQKD